MEIPLRITDNRTKPNLHKLRFVISGSVIYRPDPIEPPAAGNLLICCSQPQGDVALDL
jgi:hypothetical protein